MLERVGHGSDVTAAVFLADPDSSPHEVQVALQSLRFLTGFMCHGAEAGQAQHVQAVDMLCTTKLCELAC